MYSYACLKDGQAKYDIHILVNKDGVVVTDQDQIKATILSFYEKLFGKAVVAMVIDREVVAAPTTNRK